MTSYPNKHASHTAHQTVTEEFIEMGTAGESIRIGFTDQKISGRAGLATFCGFLGWHRFGELLVVVGFWLRPGNSSCANNVLAFTVELLGNLPRHVRLRLVRADSGFCPAPWLELLESQRLPYIVVARLLQPLQRLCRKETIWQASPVPGTAVAEVWHREAGWASERRLILIRHRVAEKKRPGGKQLLEVEGYTFQTLVTNLPTSVPPIAVWRAAKTTLAPMVLKSYGLDGALALYREKPLVYAPLMPHLPARPTQVPIPSASETEARLALAREAFLAYQTRCFWSLAPDLPITTETLPIIIAGLRRHGDRAAFQLAARLCR